MSNTSSICTRILCISFISFIIVTLGCLGGVRGENVKRDTDEDLRFLNKVLSAIEKATEFFAQDYAAINVDGLFGIRVCQGNILGALQDCSEPGFHCPSGLIEQLEAIAQRLSEMADRALPYVENEDAEYFATFKELIDGPYLLAYKSETIGNSMTEIGQDTVYSEDKGDSCFARLMGTLKETRRTDSRCTITEDCYQYMTRDGTAAYFITHQLLYFIIGEKAGCHRQLAEVFQNQNFSSVREFEKHLCGKIFTETKGEVRDGQVIALKQDLFLEQSLLCGMLGFRDFISYPWMDMVLGWQKSSGCFGMAERLAAIESKIASLEEKRRRFMMMLKEEAEKIDRASGAWQKRTLMREKVMAGDCLAHKTGLAFGTLGGYLRDLVHQLYQGES